ncbi:hypothetical protein ACFV1W_23930 [Kitasatospora sp. NPDC059648]|uniref:hypothetical protein n=1 Tax=Kitasatospora sp. NPDC059648 TaxID=3346894 RepID=UPI0036C74BD5
MSTTDQARPIGRAAATTAAAAVLTATALALSGCGAATVHERSQPTMTLDQAKKQIDGYRSDILANLPVKPATDRTDPAPYSDSECDANDIGPHGREQTERSAVFADLPLPDRTKAADAFRAYLTGRGFQVVPEPPDAHIGWVRMKNPKDDFLAVLDGATDAGRTFQLKVSSPCVWPNGTPPA